MIKYLAGAILILGALLYWSVSKNLDARHQIREKQLQIEQLEGKLAAYGERRARANASNDRTQIIKNEVKDVANRTEWGTISVPADVIERLCKATRCYRSESLPSPNN